MSIRTNVLKNRKSQIAFAALILSVFGICSAVRGESLEQAWDIAIHESREQEAKQHITAAAQSGVSAAHGARLPQVTNATAYTALSEQPALKTSVPILGTLQVPILDQQFLASTTQAIVPLYTGGKITSLIDQANARVQASESGQRASLQDLKLNVAENYLLVLRVQGIVEVLTDAQTAINSHLRSVTAMYEQGVVTKNVLLAAQVAKSDIDQKLLQAQNTLDVAKAAYNRYLWRPLGTEVSLDLVQIPAVAGDLVQLTDTAFQNRAELQQLAAESQAAYAKARECMSERLPCVAVAGGYTYIQDESLDNENYWSATVGMVWTPIDGGVSRSKQRALEHQAAAINKMRDEARTGIELQVRKCWLEERDSRQRVLVTRKAIESSEENLRMVRDQFEQQLVTHTEVLDAVTLYSQARTNYCNAAYDAILATYRLKRACGML